MRRKNYKKFQSILSTNYEKACDVFKKRDFFIHAKINNNYLCLRKIRKSEERKSLRQF